jgi:hypothetical protein
MNAGVAVRFGLVAEQLAKQEAELLKLVDLTNADATETLLLSGAADRKKSFSAADASVEKLKRGDVAGAESSAQVAYNNQPEFFHFKELVYAYGRIHRAREAVRSVSDALFRAPTGA